ncbi:serine/threonine protein phosphatase [Paenibacillus montaniterrae]|uniref:Serine/threonine protein phosphatase n=1 Tax=Paenibacillus montaniterrae TaxID=429341 RepID=A0A919YRW1_9BACL|nr:metallophosphoesterase [Paenibacillus montaniterrae]GIP18555.1 serine/threonine protein phosphatase [Paenibacillus montaniterrae]
MGRILAVSDVHGHGPLLLQLLRAAHYDAECDRLYILGDWVNKGPDSLGTLNIVQQLISRGALGILGNNERKWLDEIPTDLGLAEQEQVEIQHWLAELPLWAEDGEYLFVHAGLRPGIPLERQTATDLTEIRGEFFNSPPLEAYTVVFGHTPTFRLGASAGRIWLGPGKIGVDTGAGHGSCLSLVDLTNRCQYAIDVAAPNQVHCYTDW